MINVTKPFFSLLDEFTAQLEDIWDSNQINERFNIKSFDIKNKDCASNGLISKEKEISF
jgi:hypothetical protein